MRAAALALVGAVAFLTAVLAGTWPGRDLPVSAVGTIRMELAPPAADVARTPSAGTAEPSVRAVPRPVARTHLGSFPGAGAPTGAGSPPAPAGPAAREERGPAGRHPRPWPDDPGTAGTWPPPATAGAPGAPGSPGPPGSVGPPGPPGPPGPAGPPGHRRDRGHGRHGRPGPGHPTAGHAP